MDDMGGSSLQERMIAEQVRGTETSMVSYRGDLPEIEEIGRASCRERV